MDALLWTVRDLPYSVDFLIENFMDASHTTFAHHSLFAKRSDGSPLGMQLLTDLDDQTLIEVAFQDTILGKFRSGKVTPPCYHYLRILNSTGQWNIDVMGMAVPISPGKSRLFLGNYYLVFDLLYMLYIPGHEYFCLISSCTYALLASSILVWR
jgi:hypothetical protein